MQGAAAAVQGARAGDAGRGAESSLPRDPRGTWQQQGRGGHTPARPAARGGALGAGPAAAHPFVSPARRRRRAGPAPRRASPGASGLQPRPGGRAHCSESWGRERCGPFPGWKLRLPWERASPAVVAHCLGVCRAGESRGGRRPRGGACARAASPEAGPEARGRARGFISRARPALPSLSAAACAAGCALCCPVLGWRVSTAPRAGKRRTHRGGAGRNRGASVAGVPAQGGGLAQLSRRARRAVPAGPRGCWTRWPEPAAFELSRAHLLSSPGTLVPVVRGMRGPDAGGTLTQPHERGK